MEGRPHSSFIPSPGSCSPVWGEMKGLAASVELSVLVCLIPSYWGPLGDSPCVSIFGDLQDSQEWQAPWPGCSQAPSACAGDPPRERQLLLICKPTLYQQEASSLPVSHISQSSVWEPATLSCLSARSSSFGENDILFLYTIIGFSVSLFNSVNFGLYILRLCCLVHIILDFYICLVLLLFLIKHYSSVFLIMNFVLKSIFSWY